MSVPLVFILLFTISTFDGFSQVEKSQIKKDSLSMSTYLNYGLNISFDGSIDIIKNNYEEEEAYFYKSKEIIRFNENKKIIDANSQHLLSEEIPPKIDLIELKIDSNKISDLSDIEKEDKALPVENNISKEKSCASLSNSFSYYTHLSSLYILPKIPLKKFDREIEAYVKEHPPYHISKKLKKIKIGNKKIFKWRIQIAKTRLDHLVFFGKEYNYLFVSSPYGSNGGIEKVILDMMLVKPKNKK